MSNQRILKGSTVVAIRTPDEIYVGADSLLVSFGDAERFSICKINQIGKFFFAQTGLFGDRAGTFNVYELVRRAFDESSSDLLSTVKTFEEIVAEPFLRTLTQFREEQPDYYDTHLKDNSHFSIIFFGLEAELVVYSRFFRAIETEDKSIGIEIVRQDCPGDCPSGMTYVFLGEQSAINKFLAMNPHYSRNGWALTIRKLIGLEIAKNPNFVGPPIDIIRINRAGAEWIQRKPECPDILDPSE